MRRRECGVAIASQLVTNAAIVQRMREAVGMIQPFSQGQGLGEALYGLLPVARQLKGDAALRVRANAGIVTAELVSEVTVAVDVVKLKTVPAALQRVQDIAAKKCRRPLAMIRL